MEARGDLDSVLQFLPLVLRSSSLVWPSQTLEALKALSLGPDVSGVRSGKVLFDAILDLRDSLGLSSGSLAPRASTGFALFFDELMSRMHSRVWFEEVVPEMARLLLRLSSLLEAHYLKSDELLGEGNNGLRVMGPQEPGTVFLSQELIAALLSCAMFCLFPSRGRDVRSLPIINFDRLFASLYHNGNQSQEQKVRCLVHYFQRICTKMPNGFVSFERKVLSLEKSHHGIGYPTAADWGASTVSLCSFQIFSSGLIEDQPHEALEVDFANEYLGGGALVQGCVQVHASWFYNMSPDELPIVLETSDNTLLLLNSYNCTLWTREEIRFMINPELIVGMLFMTSMGDNEAIEIVGVERFSCYTGYGSSFRFIGDYQDSKPCDTMGRRKTRVVAIDALSSPGMSQYEIGCLLRETNKALCGFLDLSKYKCCLELGELFPKQTTDAGNSEVGKRNSEGNSDRESSRVIDSEGGIGIATGNWGCGAFRGDPEIKCIIQWIAASQGSRPFIHYYSFGEVALNRLEKVKQWILQHGWTVGDLWNMLHEYSEQRLNRETYIGFFGWLLPSN